MAKQIMLLFGLLLIIFSLNVIQSELYGSKPGELSEASSNVQENLVSLNDLNNLNIKNNIKKRDVSSVDEQEDSTVESMRVQSGQRRHSPSRFSRARRLPQLGGRGRSGRRGRIERGGREVQRGRRERYPGRGFSSRGRPGSRGRSGRRGYRRRSRGRQNQSLAGETALEEETAEDVAEEESVPYPYYYDYYDYYYYC